MKSTLLVFLVLASLLFAADRKRKKGTEVEVLEVAARRSQGTVTIDGRVRNTGAKPITNLTLVFSLMATENEVVTTQKGVIDDEVLAPGAESEFHWKLMDPARAVRMQIDATDAHEREIRVVKAGPYPIQ